MTSRHYQRNKTTKPWRHSWVVLVFLALGVFFVARETFFMYERLSAANERRNTAALELAEIEDLTSSLEERVNQLRTREGIERALRDRYGATRQGEGYIMLVEDQSQDNEEETLVERAPWWQFWR